jgi:DNA repair protein RecO (recombination protein O)
MVSLPMARSFTYSALVLRVRPSGESNREAWFLTAEEGIIKATVFGGPKSKLRAHIASFHLGKLWIYHDPVRDSRKVTDFDVQSWRPGIREQYARTITAGAVIETILVSHGGGGNWPEALRLANQALDALEGADENCCTRIGIHFLWNWVDLLGLRQDINHCASCACESPVDGVLLFSTHEGILRCPSCAGVSPEPVGSQDFLGLNQVEVPIGPGARRWLSAVEGLSPSLLTRYTLDNVSLIQARALVTGLMAGALGKRLGTWDSL